MHVEQSNFVHTFAWDQKLDDWLIQIVSTRITNFFKNLKLATLNEEQKRRGWGAE